MSTINVKEEIVGKEEWEHTRFVSDVKGNIAKDVRDLQRMVGTIVKPVDVRSQDAARRERIISKYVDHAKQHLSDVLQMTAQT